MVVLGGGAVSYERGTPVPPVSRSREGGEGGWDDAGLVFVGVECTWLPRSEGTAPPPIRTTEQVYRGTSLTRKRTPLGPYRRPMPRVLGGS